MTITSLRDDLKRKLIKYKLKKKYEKQVSFLLTNRQHPSLHLEKLEPKHLNIYSFRIDKKWRAIVIYRHTTKEIEVIDINPHYND